MKCKCQSVMARQAPNAGSSDLAWPVSSRSQRANQRSPIIVDRPINGTRSLSQRCRRSPARAEQGMHAAVTHTNLHMGVKTGTVKKAPACYLLWL